MDPCPANRASDSVLRTSSDIGVELFCRARKNCLFALWHFPALFDSSAPGCENPRTKRVSWLFWYRRAASSLPSFAVVTTLLRRTCKALRLNAAALPAPLDAQTSCRLDADNGALQCLIRCGWTPPRGTFGAPGRNVPLDAARNVVGAVLPAPLHCSSSQSAIRRSPGADGCRHRQPSPRVHPLAGVFHKIPARIGCTRNHTPRSVAARVAHQGNLRFAAHLACGNLLSAGALDHAKGFRTASNTDAIIHRLLLLAEQTGEALAPGPLRKQVDRAVAP